MIPESALLEQLRLFTGYTYSRHEPVYPRPVPGFRVPLEPSDRSLTPGTNCTTFVEGLIVPVAARCIPGFEWGRRRNAQAQIHSMAEPYSPVDALVEAGIADGVSLADEVPPWTVVQGWRSFTPPSGHALILVRCSPDGKVLPLEANRGYGLDGVGWRNLGGISQVGSRIPPRWELRTLWTLAKIRETYPHHAACALRVAVGA